MNILSKIFKKKSVIKEAVLERKVYEDWAMKGYEGEKSKINYSIYQELLEKYNIFISYNYKLSTAYPAKRFNNYDIVIERNDGHNHSLYRVHKNLPCLTNDELALICDAGNLCFGYNFKGEHEGVKTFYVFED